MAAAVGRIKPWLLPSGVLHRSQCIFLEEEHMPPMEQGEGFITELPDSIILEIFRHLNVRDLGIAAG